MAFSIFTRSGECSRNPQEVKSSAFSIFTRSECFGNSHKAHNAAFQFLHRVPNGECPCNPHEVCSAAIQFFYIAHSGERHCNT